HRGAAVERLRLHDLHHDDRPCVDREARREPAPEDGERRVGHGIATLQRATTSNATVLAGGVCGCAGSWYVKRTRVVPGRSARNVNTCVCASSKRGVRSAG